MEAASDVFILILDPLLCITTVTIHLWIVYFLADGIWAISVEWLIYKEASQLARLYIGVQCYVLIGYT